MIPPSSYESCSEAYVIEKTVEVVIRIGEQSQTVRIEALHNLRNGHFSTRAYIEEDVTVQPTYPQTNGNCDSPPKSYGVWVHYDLPWTDGDSADGVLSEALDFLSDRCR